MFLTAIQFVQCLVLHETPEHDVQAAFKIIRHYIGTLLEHVH